MKTRITAGLLALMFVGVTGCSQEGSEPEKATAAGKAEMTEAMDHVMPDGESMTGGMVDQAKEMASGAVDDVKEEVKAAADGMKDEKKAELVERVDEEKDALEDKAKKKLSELGL